MKPCVPGSTTTLTATPEENYVNVSWTAVPGTLRYDIQWSRFAGGTELVEQVAYPKVHPVGQQALGNLLRGARQALDRAAEQARYIQAQR